MATRLPSRYEDLDPAFRGRLRPNQPLISLVQQAHASMLISGGVRFLPVFGRSGSGKSSAARELSTHLPECRVIELSRAAIASESRLLEELRMSDTFGTSEKLTIAVVDEFEEKVAEKASIPTQFVERISLLDRGELRRKPVLFLWLTTSRDFQRDLVESTSRNERILLSSNFELTGPEKIHWPDIIDETFAFHNKNQPLSDLEVLRPDLEFISEGSATIGEAIAGVAEKLAKYISGLHDISKYQVVMLWPVTDGHRITRVSGFTSARDGYKLDWGAFYRELNEDDRRTLPLAELNRARLYFDVRLVPIAAADLHEISKKNFDSKNVEISATYLRQIQRSHFYSILTEKWDPSTYSPLRERESRRATDAKEWYDKTTIYPNKIADRIALALRQIGLDAKTEQYVETPHSRVRADILVARPGGQQDSVIVELKAFSTENTRPSSIKDAVRVTLKRHAQLGGFLGRQ
jgi:hypothetical protein